MTPSWIEKGRPGSGEILIVKKDLPQGTRDLTPGETVTVSFANESMSSVVVKNTSGKGVLIDKKADVFV